MRCIWIPQLFTPSPALHTRRYGRSTKHHPKTEVRPVRGEINFDEEDKKPFVRNLWEYYGGKKIDLIIPISGIEKEDKTFKLVFSSGDSLRVNAKEMEILLGKHVADFAKDEELITAKRKSLGRSLAYRLRLTQAYADETDYGDCAVDEKWIIQWIWLSTGADGEKEGQYYAIGGSDPKKYPIDLYTMLFRGVGTATPTNEQAKKAFWLAKPTRVAKILEIDSWCIVNRGRRLQVGVAMAREPYEFSTFYFLRSYYVPFRDSVDECIRAAMANALFLLKGLQFAKCFWQEEQKDIEQQKVTLGYCRRLSFFVDLTTRIQNTYAEQIRLEKVDFHGDLDAMCRVGDTEATRGVYLVRTRDDYGNYHAICIDAIEPGALIYDCAEECALKLSPFTLSFCCGEANPYFFAGFDDVRKVMIYEKTHKPKKSMSGSKKKARARAKRREMIASGGVSSGGISKHL